MHFGAADGVISVMPVVTRKPDWIRSGPCVQIIIPLSYIIIVDRSAFRLRIPRKSAPLSIEKAEIDLFTADAL